MNVWCNNILVTTRWRYPVLGSLPNSFKTFLVNLMFSFFLMSQRQVVDWWPSNSFHRGVLSTAPCIFSYLLNWHYVLFVHQGACSCLEKPFYPASYLGCQSILPLSVLLPQNSLHCVGHFCSNFARGCGSIQIIGSVAPPRSMATPQRFRFPYRSAQHPPEQGITLASFAHKFVSLSEDHDPRLGCPPQLVSG